ncbi:hypothetical protein [Mycobacterium sp.]|uniref:hypothetical protein n=1 Tax=Mycobacterium sp. TaxID=1785 RepID=UPI0031CFFDB8
MSVRRVGVGLAGGAAVAAAMLGVAVAHADEINGWTVTPTSGSDVVLLPPAMLSDPSDSLGLGTSPIAGGFDSVPATPLSGIGSNELFATPLSTIGSPDNLAIQDNWLPGIEEVSVQTGKDNNVLAFLVPADGDKQVVDLVNFAAHDAPPLFNPDATGPIDVGGVQLASPQDGALFNDLGTAVFTGDAADFGKATTLFDDLLGINPSSAASAQAYPASVDLLSQASTNLTEADSVITATPDVSPAVILNLSGVVDGAFGAGFGQGIAEKAVEQLQSAEAVVSAHDGSLSSQVGQLFFDPLNQDWDTTSAALLHADQAYEAALASGSGLDAADSSLFTADFQALGDLVNTIPILDVANLINLF